MIHHQGDRDLRSNSLFHAAAQFDGHQRIHAEVEEPCVLTDLRCVDARHLCHRVAQVIGQSFLRCCTGAFVSCSTSWVFPDAVTEALLPTARRALRAPARTGMPVRPPAGRAAGSGPSRSGLPPLCGAILPKLAARTSARPARASEGDKRLDPALLQPRTGLRIGHTRRPRTEVDAGAGDALLTQAPGKRRPGRRSPRCRRSGRIRPTPRRSRRC